MKTIRLIKILLLVFAVLAGINVLFSFLATQSNNERLRAYESWRLFIMAGHELRTASLELTRLARAFIVMGMEPQLEQYWEELLVTDRLGIVRQMFIDNEASPFEVYLLDTALTYQARLRTMDALAIEARLSGNYELALEISYGSEYTAYGVAFVNVLYDLVAATVSRTQKMVEASEAHAISFERLASAAAIAFGLFSIGGMIVMLQSVKAALRREREAVEKTRKAEESIRLIVDAAPMAISLYDKDLNIIECNEESLKMFGRTINLESIGPSTTMPRYQPDGRSSSEMLEALLNQAFQEGSAHAELILLRPDGTPRPTEIIWARVIYKDEQVVAEYVHDLTLVKAAMEKEHAVNEMSRIFHESSPVILNTWDDTYKLVSTSKQAVEMFDLSSQEEYIERFMDLSPEYQPNGEKSSEEIHYHIKRAFHEGKRLQFEWMHQTLNEEPIPTEITLARFKRQDRYMLASYTVDLRPVKAAEALTRKLLDNSPMIMEFWDEHNNMLDCNRKMLEVFGVSSKAKVIERFYDFTPECQPCGTPSQEKNFQMIQQAMIKGSSRSEWLFILPNGEELPLESTWVFIMHQDKPRIIVYSHDLRPIKQETQKVIAEMQRRKVAEDESQAKTRFLARMSHEIRTPMNAVLGIAGIQVQKQGHPPETGEAFLHIYNSATLLLNIINEILDLSEVEAGKVKILAAPYDTPSLIVDTVQLNLIYIGRKKIDFRINIDERLPICLIGDEIRIKQVLNNLLSNAIKYTPAGAVTLSLKVEEAPEAGDIVLVIEVSDSGQGMYKEQLDRLFNEYDRFNVRKNRDIEGSGLGMPITYSLIKLMRGDLNVESEPGKGSTFTVRLPQKPYGKDLLGKEAAEKLQNMESAHLLLKKAPVLSLEVMPYGRVLAVDDVDINLYVIEGMLAPYEIRVDTAGSGPEAIAKISRGEVYDIIFMDHMMPGMDGLEAAKIMQSMGYMHPIVALTANALNDTKEMFMKNGFSGFISKPIGLNELDACLTRFIRDKHLTQD